MKILSKSRRPFTTMLGQSASSDSNDGAGGGGGQQAKPLTAEEKAERERYLEAVYNEAYEAEMERQLERTTAIRQVVAEAQPFDVDLYLELLETQATVEEARIRVCGRQTGEIDDPAQSDAVARELLRFA